MSQKETLLYRLVELMLEKQQTFLLLDELYEDEVISPFVRNIQIDSPFQQLVFEGVLSQFSQREELVVSITVESYYYNLLGKVLQKDQRYTTPESLIQLVETNNLKGLKAGVSYLLSFDVELGNFNRITEMIDLSEGDEAILRLCVMPLVNSLFIYGVEKTIKVILENPTENDWRALLKLEYILYDLQLHDLRSEFLVGVMNTNPLNSKHSILLGLKAISIFDKEVALDYLNKIDTSSLKEDEEILYELGSLEDKYGKYDKALDYYLKSLEIRIQHQGADSPDLSNTLEVIGGVYKNIADFESALEYYQKALDIRLKILGIEHPHVASSYCNIGVIYRKKGEFEKALDYHMKSLDIDLKTFGSMHTDVATSYNNIGVIYVDKLEFDKALEYYQKALDIQLKTLGELHLDVATLYNNIGVVYSELGDFENAFYSLHKTLNSRMKQLGEMHPDVAIAYNSIGVIYKNKGENDTALTYHQKALDIQLATLGENHPNSAFFYTNIGLLLLEKDDEKALDYYRKALEIQIKNFGHEHPQLENIYINIATLSSNKGDFDNAIDNFQKALKIQLKTFGEDHPFVLDSYTYIAWAYSDKGDLNKALEFQQKILNVELKREELIPFNLAAVYGNIGFILKQLQKFEPAIQNIKKAYEIEKKGSFPFDIAQCFETLNDKDNALDYYLQSAEIRKERIGVNDPSTKESVSNALRLAKELGTERELPDWIIG